MPTHAYVAVSKLMKLMRRPFMEGASVNYSQSEAVVTWLRSTGDKQLEGRLDAYFEALVLGLSQEEAYDEVFAPVEAHLQAKFAASLGR